MLDVILCTCIMVLALQSQIGHCDQEFCSLSWMRVKDELRHCPYITLVLADHVPEAE